MRSRLWIAMVACGVACAWNAGLRAADPSPPAGGFTPQDYIFKSSNLADLQVYNSDNVKLGKVDDLIINSHTGQVLYGILDTGIMGKNIPVPWMALRLHKNDRGEFSLLLNMSKDQLATAPSLDRKKLPDVTDQKWQQSVDKFFGVRTVARPTEENK
jgi:hypothetical protein